MADLGVSRKIWFVFVLFGFLIVANFAVSRYYWNIQRVDADIIDVAGRDRMLSQQLALAAEKIVRGGLAEQELLQRIITLHHTSLYVLKDGGIAPGVAKDQYLPPADVAVLPQVQAVETLWLEYKKNAEIVVKEPPYIDGAINPTVSVALTYLEDHATEMLNRNDDLVQAYVVLSDSKQALINEIQLLLLVVNLGVIGLGIWYTGLILKEHQRHVIDLNKFKLAVDNTYDHVIITDPEGVIMYANKSVERITGFTASEMVGQKAGSKELWGGQMPVAFYQKMWQTIKNEKKVFTDEITNRRKNGQIYIAQASISPVLNDRGAVEFFVGIERDVTQEKEIDKTKTEFVSLASHQLRTPLSAIGWYSEMLLSGDAGQVTDQQRDFLQEINRGNRRMVNLVNALLNVSRLELGTFAVEPTEVDLPQLVQEQLKELQPQINERHHQVTTALATNLPHIQADKMLLGMVVQNLLSNAIKYTANNGQIRVGLQLQDDAILLSLQDNGFGIPSNQQEKIFTKLFRADNVVERDVEGTGLGLYIVKEIVELAGGKIWFESTEGQGTTFYVTIPLSGMKAKVGSKKLS